MADASDIEAIVRVTNRAYEVERFCLQGDRTDAADVRALMTAGQFLVVDDPTKQLPLRGSVYLSITETRGYLGILSVPFPKPDKVSQPLHLVQMTKAIGPGEEP